MFHFFTKKRFLIDALQGFVDIHNHILPGIDDGAKTVEESIALIKEFESFGVYKFIATPHIMSEFYPNTMETINSSLQLLKKELIQKGMTNIAIEAAAEYMLDEEFEILLKKNDVLPIRTNHLLIEMSYLQESLNFLQITEKISSSGVFPILAHPERYRYLHSKKSSYKQFKKRNILLQLNLLSLSDYYGNDIRKTGMYLIEHNLIDYVASDVHSLKQLKSLKEVTLNTRTYEKVMPIIRNTIEEFY